MSVKYMIMIIIFIFILLSSNNVFCLEKNDIKRLRNAGISGETISIIVSEKILETCAFSVEEIIELKKAGFKDKTLQKIIEEGSFLKNENIIVYGRDTKPLKMTNYSDIIELKNAGISEETIRSILTYMSGESSEVDRENAWEMLKNIGIILEKGDVHKK